MLFLEIFIIGVGLSADAFAVSVTNGLTIENISRKQTIRIAVAFGFFQGIMPLFGYFLGTFFASFIMRFDHFVALILLGIIGGKMIIDGIRKTTDGDSLPDTLPMRLLLLQAVATSIDAFVTGVVFISMGISGLLIIPCIAIIGVTTFLCSYLGVGLGKRFGKLLGHRARIVGGLILIGIGLRVFIEHTFFGA